MDWTSRRILSRVVTRKLEKAELPLSVEVYSQMKAIEVRTWIVLTIVGAAVALAAASLSHATKPKGKVTLYLSTDCPVAMAYTPRINRLYEEFGKRGIEFEALFPNEGESSKAIQSYMKERSYRFPARRDEGARQALVDGITRVPTAVVRAANGSVIYIGPIDDNKQPDRVERRYLADALGALLAGQKVTPSRVEAFGCILMPGSSGAGGPKVSYATDVAPILHRRCAPCHRPGEVAPFSLLTYADAKKWHANIAEATSRRAMPPWKAVEGFGDFLEPNRLTEAEIQTLRAWSQAGAPRGDAAKEPAPPKFPTDWALGTPDLVVETPRPFKVYAEGRDIYRYFVVTPKLDRPVFVRGMDVRPGNRKVVHHVIAFLDEKGRAAKLEAESKDGQPGYAAFGAPGFVPDGSLGGWAPGLQPAMLPAGTGIELKPGTSIVLQIHYHPTGKEEVDQTKIGLYFVKERLTQKAQIAWLANPFFRLKPGESNQKVTFRFPVPADVTLYALMPHMHLLGKAMKATLELPSGETRPLVWVDDWDFNWQLIYQLKSPMRIPKGSKVLVEAWYDNSDQNPNQPNRPPKEVRWGEQTTDEMFLLVCVISVDPGQETGRRWGSH